MQTSAEVADLKVAVTGATGFVGRHVLAELGRRSIRTVAAARRQAADLTLSPTIRFVPFDVHVDPSTAFERLGRPDVLIHLAWPDVPDCRSLDHIERELPGHYRLLSSLVRSGLRRLVGVGTCYEYGLQCGPLDEAAAAQPTTPYGFAKDALRRQLEFLGASQPFEWTWARLFYLYGEWQDERSLLPLLRRAVERGDSTFAMSSGEQLRDYLPARAAADELVGLALDERPAGVVNVCSGKPTSIRSLVEGWIAENGWSIRLERGVYPQRPFEAMAFWGVRTKLDELIRRRCGERFAGTGEGDLSTAAPARLAR